MRKYRASLLILCSCERKRAESGSPSGTPFVQIRSGGSKSLFSLDAEENISYIIMKDFNSGIVPLPPAVKEIPGNRLCTGRFAADRKEYAIQQ